MNDSILTESKVVVERAVRPVRASMSRKRRMREELLDHLAAICEEELERLADEKAAVEQAKQRFGDPARLAEELQRSVPAGDRILSMNEKMRLEPGESLLHFAGKYVLFAGALFAGTVWKSMLAFALLGLVAGCGERNGTQEGELGSTTSTAAHEDALPATSTVETLESQSDTELSATQAPPVPSTSGRPREAAQPSVVVLSAADPIQIKPRRTMMPDSDCRVIALAPDGKTLFACGYEPRIYDLQTGAVIRRFEDSCEGAAFSPDGESLALASGREIRLHSSLGERLKTKLTVTEGDVYIRAVSFSPDGSTLAVGATDGRITLWDIASLTRKVVFKHVNRVEMIRFSADGRLLAASATQDDPGEWESTLETLKVWDLQTGANVLSRGESALEHREVAFSPRGRVLAWSSSLNDIGVRDFENGREWKLVDSARLLLLEEPRPDVRMPANPLPPEWQLSSVLSLAFSPDGRMLAISGAHLLDQVPIRLVDSESGDVTAVFVGHTDHVTGLAFTPDGRTLVSASQLDTICLWDIPIEELERRGKE
jgi:WD40 repeat protein